MGDWMTKWLNNPQKAQKYCEALEKCKYCTLGCLIQVNGGGGWEPLKETNRWGGLNKLGGSEISLFFINIKIWIKFLKINKRPPPCIGTRE